MVQVALATFVTLSILFFFPTRLDQTSDHLLLTDLNTLQLSLLFPSRSILPLVARQFILYFAAALSLAQLHRTAFQTSSLIVRPLPSRSRTRSESSCSHHTVASRQPVQHVEARAHDAKLLYRGADAAVFDRCTHPWHLLLLPGLPHQAQHRHSQLGESGRGHFGTSLLPRTTSLTLEILEIVLITVSVTTRMRTLVREHGANTATDE